MIELSSAKEKLSSQATGIAHDIKSRVLVLKTATKWVHFCSDSASAYRRARPLLMEDSSVPLLLVGGCMAHQTNLMMRDAISVFSGLATTVKTASTVAKAINTSPMFSAAVLGGINADIRRQGLSPLETFSMWRPTLTRWYSSTICFKQVIQVFPNTLAQNRRQAQIDNVRNLFQNHELLDQLYDADRLLQPFNFAITLSEADNSTSGQILLTWLWMVSFVQTSRIIFEVDKDKFVAKFSQRLRRYGEEHNLVALVLDPRVHGAGLSADGVMNARFFARRIAEKMFGREPDLAFFEAWQHYIMKRGPFEQRYWETMHKPVLFWETWTAKPQTRELARLSK